MIDISFEIDGKKVRPGRVGKAPDAALPDSLKSDYTKKLRAWGIARRAP